MNRACMFPVLLSLLFSFAALSPAFENAWTASLPLVETVCTEWDELNLHLPAQLIAAPLTDEGDHEQVFVSADGTVEVIITRSPRPLGCTIHETYNAHLEQRWQSFTGTVDLLTKEVSADQFRLEWLTDRHILLEQTVAVGGEWIEIAASAPLADRRTLEAMAAQWQIERILALP